MNPAQHSRLQKEKQPDLFCANPKCLWRRTSGPCPKHETVRIADIARQNGIEVMEFKI